MVVRRDNHDIGTIGMIDRDIPGEITAAFVSGGTGVGENPGAIGKYRGFGNDTLHEVTVDALKFSSREIDGGQRWLVRKEFTSPTSALGRIRAASKHNHDRCCLKVCEHPCNITKIKVRWKKSS